MQIVYRYSIETVDSSSNTKLIKVITIMLFSIGNLWRMMNKCNGKPSSSSALRFVNYCHVLLQCIFMTWRRTSQLTSICRIITHCRLLASWLTSHFWRQHDLGLYNLVPADTWPQKVICSGRHYLRREGEIFIDSARPAWKRLQLYIRHCFSIHHFANFGFREVHLICLHF